MMNHHRTIPRVAISLAFALVLHSSAHANPFAKPKSPEARKHLKVGNKLLELRKYDLAIKAYNDGYLVSSAPLFLYNLGLAHRKKGNFKAAVEYYENFLRRARNARPDAKEGIKKIIDGMRAELKKREREKARESAKPKRKPQPIVSVKETPASSAPWYADGVGWGISVGGILLGGIGAGLLSNASALRSDAERELDVEKRLALEDRADTRRTWGIVLGIMGAAVLTVGIVKLIMTGKKRVGRQNQVGVVFGKDWVGLRGSF